MEGHLAAGCITNLCQNSTTEATHDVTTDVREEDEIEEELELSEAEYIPESQAVYATLRNVQQMVEGALRVYDEIKIKLSIVDIMKKRFTIYSKMSRKRL